MRRQSKARRGEVAPWVFSVMAPWALGVGVLVSFTAVAGQDPSGDLRVSPLAARARGGEDVGGLQRGGDRRFRPLWPDRAPWSRTRG